MNAPRREGFIVIAVLWILGALATLVSIYAIYVIDSAASFAAHDDRLRAEALVSGALELTVYRLKAADARPSHGSFNFRLGQANMAVEFRPETARVDLNTAPKELFVSLSSRPLGRAAATPNITPTGLSPGERARARATTPSASLTKPRD